MLVQERLCRETITNLPAVLLPAEVEAEAVPIVVVQVTGPLLAAHTVVEVEEDNGAISTIYFRL